MHKLNACVFGRDVEFYVISLRRHITLYYGSSLRAVVVETVYCLCRNVYLFERVVEVHVSVKCAHSSILKPEVVNPQTSISLRLLGKRSRHGSRSCGHAGEFYRVEIDEV